MRTRCGGKKVENEDDRLFVRDGGKILRDKGRRTTTRARVEGGGGLEEVKRYFAGVKMRSMLEMNLWPSFISLARCTNLIYFALRN